MGGSFTFLCARNQKCSVRKLDIHGKEGSVCELAFFDSNTNVKQWFFLTHTKRQKVDRSLIKMGSNSQALESRRTANIFPIHEQNSKTEIKEEKPGDLFEDLEIDAKTKCGEVYASYGGRLLLICAFCNEEFNNMILFGEHIRDQHQCQIIKENCETEVLTVTPFVAKSELEGEDAESFTDDCEILIKSNTDSCENNSLDVMEEAEKSQRFSCATCHQEYKSERNLKRHQLRTKWAFDSEIEAKRSKRSRHTSKKDIAVTSDDSNLHNTQPDPISSNRVISFISHNTEKYRRESETEAGKSLKTDVDDDHDDDDESFKPSSESSDNETCIGKSIFCDICNQAYKHKRSLARHKKKAHSGDAEETVIKEFFCVPCKKQFTCGRMYRQHQQTHNQTNKVLKHKIEPKSDPEPANDDDTKNLDFHCDICDSHFKTMLNLQIHADEHDALPAVLQENFDFLKCKFCNQQFSKYAERKEHESTHTGKRPYECPYCNKCFPSNYNRKVHIRSHTGEERFQCPHCPKVCTNKTNIKRHIARHLNIRNYGCELCDKRFYRPFELVRHMRTHTKERPYVCEDCGATYPVLAQLKDHQLRHTGVKNIKCEICGRLFYSKSVLKVHMPTHFDEKPFECDVCGRKFSRAKAMQKHQKLHSGEKRYVCNICGKAYAQDSGLYAHKKTHGANIV